MVGVVAVGELERDEDVCCDTLRWGDVDALLLLWMDRSDAVDERFFKPACGCSSLRELKLEMRRGALCA